MFRKRGLFLSVCARRPSGRAPIIWAMSDFFAFRRMVTPVVIQVLFWLGSIAIVASGVAYIVIGARDRSARELLSGLGLILFGPLAVRIYAEILIVVFRINETLTDLRALAVWTAEREHAYDASDAEETGVEAS
jgi:hypothetical protein